MPYHDVLRGLRAMFLHRTASPSDREALLAREAPNLTESERSALSAVPGERLDVYVGLLRDSQRYMLKFAAPATFDAITRFAGVPPEEIVRATLIDTPRRTHKMRELSQRVIDHLTGRGAAWVARCPPLLDLARLEQGQTESFYAPDDDGALSPPEFAACVESSTVDEVLALEGKPAAALRFVEVAHDVLDWRGHFFETGEWTEPPPRLDEPMEYVCSRDPVTLQPQWSRVDHRLLPLLKEPPLTEWESLETLAGRWVDAMGVSPDDPDACGHFLDLISYWVLYGLFAVRVPSDR